VGAVAAEPGAIVAGGRHNGLVAAAYLTRAGPRPLGLETREDTGGAARTETPWRPDFKLTALSCVMSLMPAKIIADSRLASSATHGGGGVTGIAGYLVSRRMLVDRRRAGVGLRR
jgi:phytoene dehydrogenase-like protein